MEARKRKNTPRKPRAASRDVLGSPARPPKVPTRWREHYQRLLELRKSIEQRRADSVNDALSEQPAFSTHMADAGTDAYDRDLALGMLSSEQDALYEVNDAIERILGGTYGICELTGRPIEAQRLTAVPWTRFSVAAEKQFEREGGPKRSRLGPRETVGRESFKNEPDEAD